jgi:hypothetical protein
MKVNIATTTLVKREIATGRGHVQLRECDLMDFGPGFQDFTQCDLVGYKRTCDGRPGRLHSAPQFSFRVGASSVL